MDGERIDGQSTRRDQVVLNRTRVRGIAGRVVVLLALCALAAFVTACSTASGGSPLRAGWAALVEEDYVRAEEHLRVAVEDSPGDWKPHLYLGWAYAETGDPVLAREEWVTALGACRGDQPWNDVVDVMRAYGVDASAEDAVGDAGDAVEARAAVKAQLAAEDPGKRHSPKILWWSVAAALVGVSLAGRPQ